MNVFIAYPMRFLIIICLSLVMISCTKENPSRHLDLGNWYLQRGLLDEAITEYREVSRLYGDEQSTLKRDEFQVLGTAHLKLAIAYTKKGWWEYALSEAKRSFDISPNKDCHELITLIEEKLNHESDS
jgi:tetratricopeptide (TPR) repeat protein|tara:strand:- start:923 stop:1306 length:384 start_codon:yes stop_codon:yes gene_type:complete